MLVPAPTPHPMRTLPLLVLALLAPPVTAQPLPDSTRLAINRVFAQWTASDGPGCAAGISRDGAVIYQNGFGMANLETLTPITPASIFHVASVSKQFTAAAIMLLAADGTLSLDDDIRKHLPEVPDYGHRITIRHLLTHTSGLRDQWDLLFMARGRFEENRITEDDVLEIVSRQQALNFVPGTEFLYSNTGYTLAGTIVRRVSGKSLREFADERLFRPLGMTDTHFHDDYTMVVRGRAAGYARRGTRWHVSLPNYDTYGATSLFTTVGDLLTWTANMAKPRVGTPAMWEEMRRSAIVTTGDTTGYGLGLATSVYRGARMVGHGGADAGYRTNLTELPGHGISIAVLCNAAQAIPGALTQEIVDALLGSRLAPPPAPVAARATLTREQLARFAGLYVNPRNYAVSWFTLRDSVLVAGRVTGPALIPLGERRFRVEGQPVEVEFDAGGRMTQHVLAWPPRAPVVFERRAPAQPTRADLARYAGTYHSEELGATYTVTATDSTLVLRTRWGMESVARPLHGDTFFGTATIAFTRGRSGIDGFLMSSGRVRNVRFVRR